MRDFQKLAEMVMIEYGYLPGLISIDVEGDPPVGLRYRLKDAETANRFHLLRRLMHSSDGWSSSLRVEDCDVVEVWE